MSLGWCLKLMVSPIENLQHALRLVLVTVSLLLLAACEELSPIDPPAGTPVAVSGNPNVATVPPQGAYRLQPGDAVSVFVFDNPDLSREVVVAPDGRLSYPLAGSFRAEGRTVEQIRGILVSRFSDNIVAPQVTVSLVGIGVSTIYVNGEVVQPGAFDLVTPITLVQAIARAGGFTAFAKRDRILIYNPERAGGARRIFNYDQFVTDPQGRDLLLRPGDTIIVQ